MEFVTDRSIEHVNMLKRLHDKGWHDMSSSEQKSWYAEAAKGAYNYTDLNRVESAVAELAELLGLTLTTKTDWSLWDIPVQADMERYLNNIIAVRGASGGTGFPSLPSSMSKLNYESANNIEKTLQIVYRSLTTSSSELGEFVLGESTLGG